MRSSSLIPRQAQTRGSRETGGDRSPLWVVLLACGRVGAEGETPAPRAGDHPSSLLLQVHSLSLRYAEPERILVVAADPPRAIAAKLLWQIPESNVISQPKDLDTAPALSLALAHILKLEPDASILGISCGHIFLPECMLSDVVSETLQALDDLHHVSAVVFGIPPDKPRSDRGWLLPDPGMNKECAEPYPRRLARFIEQPRHDVAQKLFGSGGLWNTFLFAGKARALWYLLGKRMSDTLSLVARHFGLLKSGDKGNSLADLYDRILPASFWSQIMAREPAEFLLVPLPAIRQVRLRLGQAAGTNPENEATTRALSSWDEGAEERAGAGHRPVA